MDGLQKQIIDLNNKVDSLYQVVEQLSSQISGFLAAKEQDGGSNSEQSANATSRQQYSPPSYQRDNISMEHKDILIESTTWGSTEQNYDNTMSPEIQIRRLTAQLTAAYNRIAALEEQLLAKRIHS